MQCYTYFPSIRYLFLMLICPILGYFKNKLFGVRLFTRCKQNNKT
uniref:Uncharacterized protein n=1 Tax=Anguilla anguilla TaxID=7936 RepID=A0A0E9R9N1_ANGAN